MLEQFLDYYHHCPLIKQIQIVWSDTKNDPPLNWLSQYNQKNTNKEDKVVFEIHKNNSLSNRFRPLIPIPTEGVLSIDDDIFIPCEELDTLFNAWTINHRYESFLLFCCSYLGGVTIFYYILLSLLRG